MTIITMHQLAHELEETARRLPREIDRSLDRVGDNLARRIPRRVPVRTGHHKSQVRVLPNGDIELGGEVAALLDRGRMNDRRGRINGSEQAPDGIVGPELEASAKAIEQEVDRGIDRALGGRGR